MARCRLVVSASIVVPVVTVMVTVLVLVSEGTKQEHALDTRLAEYVVARKAGYDVAGVTSRRVRGWMATGGVVTVAVIEVTVEVTVSVATMVSTLVMATGDEVTVTTLVSVASTSTRRNSHRL